MKTAFLREFFPALLTCLFFNTVLFSQSFDQSQLQFGSFDDSSSGYTSLMFGPDGRLYAAEYEGQIKILTIERINSKFYQVTDMELLDGIRTMADHNDDGTPYDDADRETLGLTVVGTAENPIIYVTSSDIRYGGGAEGFRGDTNLDTNSGVITRFSWNGTSWDVVDIVRGLPRSEENHATNGLEFATINGRDYLIVASGGHTNAGGPSVNFVFSCEYALSGAILSVDLTALEAMPIKTDNNGRNYIYDLPTVDDPTRANANGITDPDNPGYDGIDINDPWGGNDGLNQAIIDPSGPVQIYSPGYRNAYDLVITESGALYVTDNGANLGWGGFPVNEGGGNATNEYDPDEPGSQEEEPDGEVIDNQDHLQLVTTNIATYTPGSLYGGHPNPIRANPSGAGLFTDDDTSQVFRNLIYDPDGSTPGSTTDPSIALPANWPPVSAANPVEGDWRGPSIFNPEGPQDNPVTIWSTNTNGIDEYTASNFDGALKGDLIAGRHGGVLRRVQLKADGTLEKLTSNFLEGAGGNALGITCNGDDEIFPGSIWVGTLNKFITVYEPLDFFECTDVDQPGYDSTADGDSDGYSNQDEVDNGTQVCNGGSQPQDFDKAAGGDLVSDLNDPDDDNDGIPDAEDPFQLGDPNDSGSDAFNLPILNDLFNDQQGLGGIFGLGMTGLMNNGDTGANWLDWAHAQGDSSYPDDVLGGAPGIMTSWMNESTALGTENSQTKGYQYGVQVDDSMDSFTVVGRMNGFTGPFRLYENTDGVMDGELGFFIGDGTQSNYIKFVVTTDGFTALQEINDVPGDPFMVSIPVNQRTTDGILFYFIVDTASGAVTLEYEIEGSERTVLSTISAQGTILEAIQSSAMDLAVGFIGSSNTVGKELQGSWDYLHVYEEELTVEPGEVLVRVNASGSEVQDASTGVSWQANNSNGATSGAGFSVNAGIGFPSGLLYENRHSSIPANMDASTFEALFARERYDPESSPEMQYDFPLPNGNYVVNIFAGNAFEMTSDVGERVFDIMIEGQEVGQNVDLIALFGHQSGGMLSYGATVQDGVLNLQFVHNVENPLVNAIEIRAAQTESSPIVVQAVANQVNSEGDELDGSLSVVAAGGEGNLNFTMSGQPSGVFIEPINGQIGGSIDEGAALNSPYTVFVRVDDNDDETSDSVLIQFEWVVNEQSAITEWTVLNENKNYTARHENSFVQAGDKFYLMGGRENSRTIDVYDYANNTWTALQDSAPFEFNHFQAVEYQGLIWVIGAFKTNAFPNEIPADYIWAFDPATEEWIQGPEIPEERKRGSAGLVVYQDKFYVICGNNDGHDGGYVNQFDVFDPATGTWTVLDNAPRARDHFAAAVIDDKLYIAGGRLSGGPSGVFAPTIAEVDVYDFSTSSWSTLPIGQNLPTGRAGAVTVTYNDELFVVGGEILDSSSALATTEIYNPQEQEWTSGPDLNAGRHGTQAIVSGDGIFVLSGSPNRGGGTQKVMEYLGNNNPQGTPLVSSSISAPNELVVDNDGTADFDVTVTGGNTGIFITSMEISGPDADDFSIVGGDLDFSLLNPSTSHTVDVAFSGTGTKNAVLTINYGTDSTLEVNLSSDGTVEPTEGVTSLIMVNANSNEDLFEITNGQEIDLGPLGAQDVNIRAITQPGTVGSVSIELSGPVSNLRTEGVAPYALFGDASGNYNPNSLPLGDYTLSATAYNGSGASGGVLGQPLVIQFSVVYDDGSGNTNAAPVAIAQASTVSGTAPLAITFTGSNSTDDTGIVSYSWDFGDGNTSNGTNPSHTFQNAGTFTVALTVTDAEGEFDTDTIIITVNESVVNQPPVAVANASTVSGTAPLAVAFMGNSSSDDSGIVSYSWDFDDGITSGGINPSHIFENPGIYTVTLTVTDAEGESDKDTIVITVNESTTNQAPVALANASITSGTAPLAVAFMGDDSTDDNGIVSYSWDFGDGSTSAGINPSHIFQEAGTYTVTLSVTDEDGLTNSNTITIVVLQGNTNGVVSFTLVNALTNQDISGLSNGQQINLGASGANSMNIRAETAPETVGSVYLELTGPVSNTRTEGVAPYALFGDAAGNYHPADLPLGEYTLTATAYNASNRNGGVLGEPLTIQFSVVDTDDAGTTNESPIAIASASVLSGTAPLNVDFSGSASSDDSGIVSYFWDFGNGSSSSQVNPSHVFQASGTYNVLLTVTDAEGEMSTDGVTIIVEEPVTNDSPIVNNPGNQTNSEGDVVSLQISASDDSNNLSYSANGLPLGLSINPTTGLISGTISASSGSSTSDAFQEANGIVVIEAESGNTNGWGTTNQDGATGIIANTNSFANQNGSTIPYEITISTPGVYRFNWRSFFSGSHPTEENDNWLRFPNNDDVWFFGLDDSLGDPGNEANIIANLQGSQSGVVFPKGSSRVTSSTSPEGNGSNGYFKIYRIGGTGGDYSWDAFTADFDPHDIYVWFVNAGTYTMEVSERSSGHAIDRMALYKVDTYGHGYNTATLTNLPESQRSSSTGNSGAADNSPYNVTVTVTDDGEPQESTSVSFIWTINEEDNGSQTGLQLESFTLIDAASDNAILAITDGLQIASSLIPNTGINVRANPNSAQVGSIAFSLSGPVTQTRVENVAPYALFGDVGGDFTSMDLPIGSYTLTGTPYTGMNSSGEIGTPLIVSFTVTANNSASLGSSAAFLDGNSLQLSPNPAANSVTLNLDSFASVARILVYDISGQLVQTVGLQGKEGDGSSYEMDISSLNNGTYLLHTLDSQNRILHQDKLVVRK